MPFTPAELTVIVVHYRTPLLLGACLRRLYDQRPVARLIVVDSGSCGVAGGGVAGGGVAGGGVAGGEDDAAQTRAVLASFPGTERITVANHSFAAAANAGLRRCQSPVAAILNADVLVGERTFPELLGALGHARVGLAGPLALTPEGRVQDQGLPYRRHSLRVARLAPGKARAVPWLAGCLLVVRMEAVAQVGGMDPSFRFYNEDIDWSWRMRQAGWRCALVNSPVLHVGGSATPSAPAFLLEGYRGGYLLSRRYRGRAYRWLHRQAILTQALFGARWSKDPMRREAFRRVAAMVRQARYDQSPFGATLDDR